MNRQAMLRAYICPFVVMAAAIAFQQPAHADELLDRVREKEYRELEGQLERRSPRLPRARPAGRGGPRSAGTDPPRRPRSAGHRLAADRRPGGLFPAAELACGLATGRVRGGTRPPASGRKDRTRRSANRALPSDLRVPPPRDAMANPLLDFDAIACMLEQPGEERIVEQARAVWRGHSTGGGPIVIRNFKSHPASPVCWKASRWRPAPWKGRELTGKFSGLELSYDARQILFAATTDVELWRIFAFDLATGRLVQLTDGPFDDFDPCLLPSAAESPSPRRGAAAWGGACSTPQSLTYTLYSMEPDGTDIIPLSYHETNEWQPSVNNEGKLVYTRWDYVDRHWGTAHHFWECFPDGRDPRSYHGNYPCPGPRCATTPSRPITAGPASSTAAPCGRTSRSVSARCPVRPSTWPPPWGTTRGSPEASC